MSVLLKFQEDLSSLLPIGEKKKLLNQFLNNIQQESDLNDILRDCKELSSVQYNLLKFSLADRFQRSDFIIELLYNGENAIISNIVTKRWIYDGNASRFTDNEFLMNQLFPNVSYNCRRKVLNKIGRFVQNGEQVDKIWNAVEERYGFSETLTLLQACTKDKINYVLSTRPNVPLEGYQVTQILQKYPDVGLEYLKNQYNSAVGRTHLYCGSLLYLFNNHPDEFLDLLINYSKKMWSFVFGRNRAIKLIRTYREKLLEQPRKFSSILPIERIRREFSSEEFQIFFESTLPENPDHIHSPSVWKWVKTVPVDKRLNMITSAFSKVYQINFDEHPSYISPEFIVLLSDEKRLSVIDYKMKSDFSYGWSFNDLNNYYYKEPEKKVACMALKPIRYSVPELEKQLLIEQDVHTRAALSKYLIQTCYVNQDQDQLLHVLTLLNKRSRNDQPEVRREIFQAIESIIKVMQFTKKHWDVILEMIQVSIVFKDCLGSERETLLEKCIAFHIKSKLPANNIAVMLIKIKIENTSMTWSNSYLDRPSDIRTFLEMIVQELENTQSLDSKLSKEYIVNLIDEICKFNKIQVKQTNGLKPILIASHQWLRTSFEQIAKEEETFVQEKPSNYWNFAEKLCKILQVLKNEENLLFDAFTCLPDILSKILQSAPCVSIFNHFLHKDPSVLNQNWASILPNMLKTEVDMSFIRQLKSSNYSTLLTQSIKICSEIFNQEVDSSDIIKIKCNAVDALSILSEPNEFLTLAAQHYPLETKVDVFAEKSDEDYKIKETFAKSLINVTIPYLDYQAYPALPAVEKFCVGDYLKLVLGSLYSHVGRAPETKAIEFLRQQVFSTRVSLQKHIIRLYFKLCSTEDRVNIINKINSSNVSIRHELFLQAVKLFRTLSSDATWAILKSIIEKISEDNVPTIKYLASTPNIDTCPQEFLFEYICACLTVLRKGEQSQVDNFLAHVTEAIDKIPEDILDDIILYKHEEAVNFNSAFCVAYLMSASTASILSHRLVNMWSILHNVIRNAWDETAERSLYTCAYEFPTRSLIFAFISTLCTQHLNDSTKVWVEKQVLETLLEKFKAESVTKFFKETLYIDLALLLLAETDKKDSEKLGPFGSSLAQYIDSTIQQYGGEIITMICETVVAFLQAVISKEFNNNGIVELVNGMFASSESRYNQITLFTLLPYCRPKAASSIATLEQINMKLSKTEDELVQIYRNYKDH